MVGTISYELAPHKWRNILNVQFQGLRKEKEEKEKETWWRWFTLKWLKVHTWWKSCVVWPAHHPSLPPCWTVRDTFLLYTHQHIGIIITAFPITHTNYCLIVTWDTYKSWRIKDGEGSWRKLPEDRPHSSYYITTAAVSMKHSSDTRRSSVRHSWMDDTDQLSLSF